MLKVSCCLLVLVAVVHISQGAVLQGPLDAKPGRPGQCYFTNSKGQTIYFPAGSSGYDRESCMEYECADQKQGRLYMTGYTCGAVAAEPPCYVTGNRPGNYPNCCPTVVCPGSPGPNEI